MLKTPAGDTDVLSEVLEAAEFELMFANLAELRGPFGVAIPGDQEAALHVVLEGRVVVGLAETGEHLELRDQQLIVLPVDVPHSLSDRKGRRLLNPRQVPGLDQGPLGTSVRLGTSGPRTRLLTAAFRLKRGWTSRLLRVLPAVITTSRSVAPHLFDHAARLEAEIQGREPGRRYLLRRGFEALFVEALRTAIDLHTTGSLVGALGDRHLRAAVEALHRQPRREWTVTELGALAGLSRSAFAERFRAGLGVTPRQYLIRWRMERATTLLATTDLALGEIAQQVGYESEAAFSRTYRSVTGTPPATFRRTHRRRPEMNKDRLTAT